MYPASLAVPNIAAARGPYGFRKFRVGSWEEEVRNRGDRAWGWESELRLRNI